MLTSDVAVDVLYGSAGLQGDQVTHTGGVQHGTRTEDLVLGQASDLLGAVGNYVNRVSNQHEDSVRSNLDQLGQNLLHDANGSAG